MKKITLLLLLTLSILGAKAQTTYVLNYDSIRVGKTTGTGGTSLYGKVYLKNVGLGLVSDSILTVLNGKIRKIPVSGVGNNGVTPTFMSGKKAVFFGTSITSGSGATTLAQRYSSLLAGYLDATEINYGSAGSVLQKRVPVDANGGVNMVDQLPNVPVYDSTYAMIVVSHGINDVGYNGTNYTVANFKADYETILTNIITTKGWPSKNVLIIGPEYMTTAGYALYNAAYPANPATGLARHVSFIAASEEKANAWGTMYLNIYDVFAKNGGADLLLDDIHPNDAGHEIYARAVYKYLYGTYPDNIGTRNSLVFTTVKNVNPADSAGAGFQAKANGGSSYLYRNSTANVANPNETILLAVDGNISLIAGGSTPHLRVTPDSVKLYKDAIGLGFRGSTSYKLRRNGLSTVQSGFQLESATGTVYGQNFQLDDVGGLALWSYDDGTAAWSKSFGVSKLGLTTFNKQLLATTSGVSAIVISTSPTDFAFGAQNTGGGDIARLSNNSTTVFTVANSGNTTLTGTFTGTSGTFAVGTNNNNAVIINGSTVVKSHIGTAFGGTFLQNNVHYNGSAYSYDDNTLPSSLFSAINGTLTLQTGVANTAPSNKVTVSLAGGVQFNTYGAGTLTTDASGNITATSDRNAKEKFEPYTKGLDALKSWKPQSYNWKKKTGLDTENRYVSLIAQDVKKTVPEAIGKMADGTLTVQDRVIMATMINAINELSERLEKAEAKIKELELK